MTYRQIETSREIRLWLGQVIIPAGVVIMASPEARRMVVEKSNGLIRSIKNKVKKTNNVERLSQQ